MASPDLSGFSALLTSGLQVILIFPLSLRSLDSYFQSRIEFQEVTSECFCGFRCPKLIKASRFLLNFPNVVVDLPVSFKTRHPSSAELFYWVSYNRWWSAYKCIELWTHRWHLATSIVIRSLWCVQGLQHLCHALDQTDCWALHSFIVLWLVRRSSRFPYFYDVSIL